MRRRSSAQLVQNREGVCSSPMLPIRALSARDACCLQQAYNRGMIANIVWLSLAKAAEYLDVSKDTVLRRAVEWTDEPVPGKVRTKYLVLGADTRQDRRYYLPDMERWLSAKAQTNRGHIKGHFAPA